MEFADLDLTKTYTYADYFKWKFAQRVELIKGKIFKMGPAPNTSHQRLVGAIYLRLANFLDKQPCSVFVAPFDVRFLRRSNGDTDIITVLQPDVCVICDASKIDSRGCLGAPDLVVEVLSPGNNAKELKNKYDIYEESGVKEYWIVSPQNRWLRICTLVDGKFKESPYYLSGDIAQSAVLNGFSLNVADLFNGIPEE